MIREELCCLTLRRMLFCGIVKLLCALHSKAASAGGGLEDGPTRAVSYGHGLCRLIGSRAGEYDSSECAVGPALVWSRSLERGLVSYNPSFVFLIHSQRMYGNAQNSPGPAMKN
jgi:hypothetical protein